MLTFTGEYEHSLDAQRRIAIPTCWRRKGEENIFFLLPGRHGALQLIPQEGFNELLLKARKVSFADPAASLALARLGSMAQESKCDKQGRFQIPQKLIDFANLKESAVMVGALTSVQIWAPENWNKVRPADETVLDEIQKIGERADSLTDILKGKL
jgi:division/cell wall cluster transcriptional repressor MraZ